MFRNSYIKSLFGKKKWKYVANSDKLNKSKKEQYVFIHIPKTAGTTFRFVLYNHFKPSDIYPTQADLKDNGGSYLTTKDFLKRKKFLNKSMVIGHFHIAVANKIENGEVKKMAFFRNPLDRVVSTIKHMKTYNADYHGTDVNVILEKNWNRIINGQCTAMGFNFENRNMEEVRQNIIDLDFIGITEFFEESIQLCNTTFDWKLENIEPRNIINDEIFSQLSKKSKMNITKDFGPEINTYNIALNHFRQRCKKHNIQLPH